MKYNINKELRAAIELVESLRFVSGREAPYLYERFDKPLIEWRRQQEAGAGGKVKAPIFMKKESQAGAKGGRG